MEAHENSGISTDVSYSVASFFLNCLDGGYNLRNLRGSVTNWKTNSVSTIAFRGFGGNEAHFVAETMVEHLAFKFGVNSMELKARNLSRSGDRIGFGDAM